MREVMRECREALTAQMRAADIAKGGNMSRVMALAIIAAKLGVSSETIRNWERGVSSPRGDKLLEMERLYGRSAEELLK